MRWTGEMSDYWPPQVLGRRVAAVVSFGVATAVVPQQGYAANILTPSVTQVSLPLINVHNLHIDTEIYSSHSLPFLLLLLKSSDASPTFFPLHPSGAGFLGPQLSDSVHEGQVPGWPGGWLPLGEAAMLRADKLAVLGAHWQGWEPALSVPAVGPWQRSVCKGEMNTAKEKVDTEQHSLQLCVRLTCEIWPRAMNTD